MDKIFLQKKTTKLTLLTLVLCIFNFSCKHTNSNPSVIGGVKTNKYPGVIQIIITSFDKNNIPTMNYCTATVVSASTIITAAHCLAKGQVDGIFTMTKPHIAYASNFKIHPKYTEKTSQFDVAVVVFENNPFSTLRPIIPLFSKVSVNTPVTLIGYGCLTQRNEDGKVVCQQKGDNYQFIKRVGTSEIQSLNDTPILSNLKNKNDWGSPCGKNMIELKYATNSSDQEITTPTGKDVAVSKGDSGGPLLIHMQNEPYIVGIASTGRSNKSNIKEIKSCYAPLYTNMEFFQASESEIKAEIPGI